MRTLFLLFIIVSIVFSKVQTVRVGKIDKQYSELLSKESLVQILYEIETLFEKQLGFDVINYSEQEGKPIDIVYLQPSVKKKRILRDKKKSEQLKIKIDTLANSISHKKTLLKKSKSDLEREYDTLNKKIQELNNYISTKNSSNKLSNNEYNTIKTHVSKEKSEITVTKRKLDRKKRNFNTKLRSLNNQVTKNNVLISQYNYYQRDIEKLSQSYQEIKGKTKKNFQTITIVSTQYGESTRTESKHSVDEKIEIYDFENLNLLKVILAHEIGHLVGVKHIDVAGALMHPYLQEEQINHLSLTIEDINAFYESFNDIQ